MKIRSLAGVALLFASCAPARSPAPQAKTRPAAIRASAPVPTAAALRPVDFAMQIRPILEKRCQPCHFTGGKMYEKMPFDRPQTIRTLGQKMFTRIKDPQEQELLRSFLAQEAPETNGVAR
ncbi:MAG: hypothetical protein JF614_23415 [Acidobacteria bacterium]|nr:hypothetical protein [Acidobacteriota bacterium]